MKKSGYLPASCLLLALSAGLLTGCAAKQSTNLIVEQESPHAASHTDLTFFGFKYEALNVMAIEDALRSFMDAHPDISISYDGIKGLEYFDVLEKRLSTGHGDDIFMVNHERLLDLRSQGLLADLSDLSTLDQFSSLAKSQIYAGQQVDYLPTSISAFGLYCNLDLLKEHGQKVPENLADFTAVCDYFVSQGITPVVANNDISLKTVVIARGMLPFYQQEDPGAAIRAFNEKPEDLTDALRPGFTLVEEMLDRGWADRAETLTTERTKDDLTLFAVGDRPFMLTGAWAVPRLRDLKPGFQFEVRPYPIMEDGSVLVINVDTRISIYAGSSNLKEAKIFVEHLTQPDVMWKFVDSQCSFSPLAENRLAEDDAIQPVGPYLTNGRSVIGSDDNLNFPIWDITRQCIIGMLKGGSAGDAAILMDGLLEGKDSSEGR